jgi:hypothetical protein
MPHPRQFLRIAPRRLNGDALRQIIRTKNSNALFESKNTSLREDAVIQC